MSYADGTEGGSSVGYGQQDDSDTSVNSTPATPAPAPAPVAADDSGAESASSSSAPSPHAGMYDEEKSESPSAAEPAEQVKSIVEPANGPIGFAEQVAKASDAEGAEHGLGAVGGTADVVSGTMGVVKGVSEMSDGDVEKGVVDAGTGAADMVKGGANVLNAGGVSGADSVANGAGMVSGGIQVGAGLINAAQGIHDGNDVQTIDGTYQAVKGGVNMCAASSSPAAPVCAAAGAGMAVGDAAAPYVFPGPTLQESTACSDTSTCGPTTGNKTVDAVVKAAGEIPPLSPPHADAGGGTEGAGAS